MMPVKKIEERGRVATDGMQEGVDIGEGEDIERAFRTDPGNTDQESEEFEFSALGEGIEIERIFADDEVGPKTMAFPDLHTE
jgi:hypothetical protein